jgi:hypothetical protein
MVGQEPESVKQNLLLAVGYGCQPPPNAWYNWT